MPIVLYQGAAKMGDDWTTTSSGKQFVGPKLWVSHQDLRHMIEGSMEVVNHAGVKEYVKSQRESIKSLAEQKVAHMTDLITNEDRKDMTPKPPGRRTSPFQPSLVRPQRII